MHSCMIGMPDPAISTLSCAADSPGKLPTLPSDILDNILGLVKQSWRARPQVLAKDEVSPY